ncbi:MAG: hypothetical protein ACE5NG_19935, partial [bacterium]
LSCNAGNQCFFHNECLLILKSLSHPFCEAGPKVRGEINRPDFSFLFSPAVITIGKADCPIFGFFWKVLLRKSIFALFKNGRNFNTASTFFFVNLLELIAITLLDVY